MVNVGLNSTIFPNIPDICVKWFVCKKCDKLFIKNGQTPIEAKNMYPRNIHNLYFYVLFVFSMMCMRGRHMFCILICKISIKILFNNDNKVQWAIGNINSSNLNSSLIWFQSEPLWHIHVNRFDTLLKTACSSFIGSLETKMLYFELFSSSTSQRVSYWLSSKAAEDEEKRGGCWKGRWRASAALVSPHTLHNKWSLYDLGFSYLHLEPSKLWHRIVEVNIWMSTKQIPIILYHTGHNILCVCLASRSAL